MNAGIDLAIGDFVYEFDTLNADFPKEIIMEIYRRCLAGYDIVSAAPTKNPRITSRIYYKIFNSQCHSNHPLEYETVRILTRRAINRVHGMSQKIPYRKAFYANCGLKKDTLYYSHIGLNIDSRTTKEKTGFALNSLVLFTNIAYKTAFIISIIMMLFALGIAVYALVTFFGGLMPIEGWTSTMLFLSVGFFGLFALIGMVLKYISILVDLVFNKQKYFVESVEKISNRR